MYIPTKLKSITGKLKGAYIKYVGPEGFTNFSKKNCSPGDHRPKFFMAQ